MKHIFRSGTAKKINIPTPLLKQKKAINILSDKQIKKPIPCNHHQTLPGMHQTKQEGISYARKTAYLVMKKSNKTKLRKTSRCFDICIFLQKK